MVIKNSGSSQPAWAKSWHKTNFFKLFFFFVLTSTFLTFRLPINYTSSFFLNHKAYNYYRNGTRKQKWNYHTATEEGLIGSPDVQPISCMAFGTVEDVHLAPLNQLSRCLNTPAHTVAGDGVSQPSAFLWTLHSVHIFLEVWVRLEAIH